MPPRQSLTARLEDLTSQLEALRYFRRQRIITDARAFQRERDRLVRAIQNVEDDIQQQRRSLEIQRQIQEEARRQEERRKLATQKRRYLKNLNDSFARGEPFTISLRNNFITDNEILNRIVRQAGRWTLSVNGLHYTLNDKTRTRLRDMIERGMVQAQVGVGSDAELIQFIQAVNEMTIAPIDELNTYAFDNGAFFKYLHLTHYDFSRYGIYSSIVPENYNENCLIYAFKLAGVEPSIIEDMKLRMKNRNIPRSDLKQIAEDYNLTIFVRTANQEKAKTKPFMYGSGGKVIYLGSLDNHYFINEKTNFTRFCIENYEEVKNLHQGFLIYKRKGKYYERDAKRCIDSYDLVKLLLEKKDVLLKEITMNDQLIATTQFYDKINDEITHLDYSVEKCCRPVAMPKESKDEEYKTIFFDFETYTKNSVHIPYLCVMYDGNVKQTFYGETCGLQMLLALNTNTRLIAHNAHYDYRFLIRYLSQIEELSRGNRLIGCNAIFNGYKIQVKDSYHLISMALKKFPKIFGLNVSKEVMFYNFYSEETIRHRWYKPSAIYDTLVFDEDDFKTKDEAYNHLLQNIKLWNLENSNGEFDIIEYSRRYCEIDCEILQRGYTIFREWNLKLLDLDIDNILTIASLAHRYLISKGCYEGVNELSGIPQAFIQGAVVGGRTMVSENKKIKIEGKINDFDAVSLYPSAMHRMDGFLKGTPKIITELTYDFLKQQDGYFVDVLIKNVAIHRKFPLMSYKNEDGVRLFTNDMVGRIIRVDRYALEDLIQFQGISFDVLRGYYFNEGFNTKINEVIKFLFEERLRMKKEENPAQEVYKLIMNSGYGKSIMKPVETETKIFDDEKKFKIYLSRHYNWVSSFVKFGSKIKVNMIKTLNDHFNIAQVGTMILSMSKRIMNEVMCLAEDNGLDIYYQDTDSNHILDKDIEILANKFYEKYNRKLVGKGFGQFHSDFEIKGADDVYSRRAIFLGKKCYIDELVGMKNGKEVIDYHIRMKGVPNSCIKYTAKKLGYDNVFKMYDDLYNGKAITFDLTQDGSKANFKFEKNYNVKTCDIFSRCISF